MTARVLVLNGPNLGSLLGEREREIYGSTTWEELQADLRKVGDSQGLDLEFHQSNHEGELIDIIDKERGRSRALIINPGGLTHTSVSLLDALRAFDGYVVEVHLSNIYAREPYRQKSVTAEGADAVVAGLGADGYRLALEAVARRTEATG